jgi:hypothetical protein
MSTIPIFIICKMQGFLLILAKKITFFRKIILLAFSKPLASLASARSIRIQLRFAALYMMHYKLFQQTLIKLNINRDCSHTFFHLKRNWIIFV